MPSEKQPAQRRRLTLLVYTEPADAEFYTLKLPPFARILTAETIETAKHGRLELRGLRRLFLSIERPKPISQQQATPCERG
jgi:hypothetical protein